MLYIKGIRKIERDRPLDNHEHEILQNLISESGAYRSLFEYHPDAIYVMDKKGNYIYTNPGVEKISGYTIDMLDEVDNVRIFGAGRTDIRSPYVAEVLKGKSIQFQTQIYHRQGHLIDLDVTYTPIVIQEEIVGIYGIAKDITSRNNIEQKFKEAERMYRLISENADDLITCSDAEGRIIYISPSVEKILGYSPSELIQTLSTDLIYTEDILQLEPPFQSRKAVEIRCICKDRSFKWIELTVKAITDEDGETVQYMGIGRDITARKQSEEKLRKSEERLSLAQSIAGFGYWDWNLDTQELICSEQFLAILGLESPSAKLLYRHFLAMVHYDDRDKVRSAFRQSVAQEHISIECRLVDSNNQIKTVNIQGTLVSDDQDGTRQIVGTIQDITESRLMEDLIRESERQYRMLSNNTLDLISSHTADEHLNFLYTSASVKKLLGYTGEELIGKSAYLFYHPEDFQNVIDYIKGITIATEHNEQQTVHYRFQHKAGHYIWLESTATYTPSQVEGIQGTVIAVSRDVTDRKLAEQRLQESEQRYKSLVEYNPSGVYTFDLQGRLFNLNPVAEIQSGYDRTELKNIYFAELIHSDLREQALDHFNKAKMGMPQNYETTLVHHKGHQIEVNITNVPIIVSGEITGVFGIATDITESKKYVEQIKKISDEYNLILSSVSEGIYGVDTEGNGIFLNAAAASMLGVSKEEFIGSPVRDILMHTRADGEPYALAHHPVELTMQDSISRRVTEDVFFRRDGSSFFASYQTNALRDRDRIIGVVVVFSDRTNEKAIIEAKESAERVAYAKSQFISMMSHEIRTPMNGIVGMAELMLDLDLNEEQASYIHIIRQSGNELMQIINDIMDVHRLENGNVELEQNLFDLHELINEVYQWFLPTAQSKHLVFEKNIEQEVPQLARGDMPRIKQVLVNIIGNAIKFTEKGNIRISAGISYMSQEDGMMLHFRITDTGIGIPADKLNELFHSFSQVHPVMNRRYGGTGLGLFICKNLIELMNGTIGVESQEHQGSTFYFSIPLQLK